MGSVHHTGGLARFGGTQTLTRAPSGSPADHSEPGRGMVGPGTAGLGMVFWGMLGGWLGPWWCPGGHQCWHSSCLRPLSLCELKKGEHHEMRLVVLGFPPRRTHGEQAAGGRNPQASTPRGFLGEHHRAGAPQIPVLWDTEHCLLTSNTTMVMSCFAARAPSPVLGGAALRGGAGGPAGPSCGAHHRGLGGKRRHLSLPWRMEGCRDGDGRSQ